VSVVTVQGQGVGPVTAITTATALVITGIVLLTVVRFSLVRVLGEIRSEGGLRKPELGRSTDPIAERRAAIIAAGPKTFYYLDSSQIEDLYAQMVSESEPGTIEVQEKKSRSAGVDVRLRFLSPKFGRSRDSQITKKYEGAPAVGTMYNRAETALFRRNDVNFGLELYQPDRSAVAEFQAMVQTMRDTFNFTIPDDLQQSYVQDSYQTVAENRIRQLKAASGYAALQATFKVSNVSAKNRCDLVFDHPVNEDLEPSTPVIGIRVVCAPDGLTSSGRGAFGDGESVKATCVGKIVRWDDERWQLVINAIAMY